MAFVFIGAAIVGAGAAVAGTVAQVKAAGDQKDAFEAQAKFEQATTERQVAEERERTSENLLRAQEEKRKELSRQRAAFISAGVLPDSPSANFLIGELGENLQTNIQDVFVSQSDRIQSIQSQGQARHFNALENANAASRQRTGALISGASSLASSAYSFKGKIGNSPKSIKAIPVKE